MKKTLHTLAAGLALGLATHTGAHAQTGLYLAVGAGFSSYDIDCAGTRTCDNEAGAVRAALGWRSAAGIGVEALYTNFGTAKATVDVPGSGLVAVDLKSSMAGVGAVVFLPLSPRWDLALRLGVARVESRAGGSVGGISVDLGKDSTTSAYVGIGTSWAVTPTARFALNWDSTRFESVGDEANVGAFTAGVRLEF
ncbi:outer membrane beta-barrel protein [Rubrivivax sp. RP6-9]|uniref:outer membrane beta-barrel protein n=1 Tax=Rubrivivax sp. RP6-9 TaxID=3415750 RepID=UPI003CC51DAD